jgi:hypothetical protein
MEGGAGRLGRVAGWLMVMVMMAGYGGLRVVRFDMEGAVRSMRKVGVLVFVRRSCRRAGMRRGVGAVGL